MKELRLAIDNNDTRDTLYAKLLDALGAPEWHEKNLDALWDTVTGDDVNRVRAPYVVIVRSASQLQLETEELVLKVHALFQDARTEGLDVQFKLDDEVEDGDKDDA